MRDKDLLKNCIYFRHVCRCFNLSVPCPFNPLSLANAGNDFTEMNVVRRYSSWSLVFIYHFKIKNYLLQTWPWILWVCMPCIIRVDAWRHHTSFVFHKSNIKVKNVTFQKNKSRPVFLKSVESVTFRVIVTNIELFRGHCNMLYDLKITILIQFLSGGYPQKCN